MFFRLKSWHLIIGTFFSEKTSLATYLLQIVLFPIFCKKGKKLHVVLESQKFESLWICWKIISVKTSVTDFPLKIFFVCFSSTFPVSPGPVKNHLESWSAGTYRFGILILRKSQTLQVILKFLEDWTQLSPKIEGSVRSSRSQLKAFHWYRGMWFVIFCFFSLFRNRYRQEIRLEALNFFKNSFVNFFW